MVFYFFLPILSFGLSKVKFPTNFQKSLNIRSCKHPSPLFFFFWLKPNFTCFVGCVEKTQPSFGISQNCIKIFPLKDLTLLRALFSYIRPNLCGCLYHLPLSGILEICSLPKLIKLFSKCCYCTAIFDLTGKSIGYIILKVISICYR